VNSERTPLDYQIRPFRDEDEDQVVELLQTTMGDGPTGRRTVDFFRWKHLENPFGPSHMLVAEADRLLIGFRAFMRWRFRANGRVVRAVQAVDTATHPDYQGMGIFSALTRRAVESLRDDVDMIYNTPNDKSLPGYLKMGWQTVGRLPVWVRVRRPIRLAKGLSSLRKEATRQVEPTPVDAEPATTVLADDNVKDLLARRGAETGTLSTARSHEYLTWRYGSSGLFDYRAVTDSQRGRVQGLAIFRIRPRGSLLEAALTEVIMPRDDPRTIRRLLHGVTRASNVDHLSGHFPQGSALARSAMGVGFVRAPIGITLVVNPLGSDINPDPTSLRSWSLSLGDLEVF
jgi:GNAT superfamily N-acetyltransferase